MSNQVKLSVSPHIHSGNSTQRIMLDVLIALLPTTIAGVIIFGWKSLIVLATCIISCVGFEALFNLITKRTQTVKDLSAAVTGLLLALNLSVVEQSIAVTVFQCVIGSLFAIIVVKCLFGGIGCNVVNPAIAARVFMLIAFGSMAKAGLPTIVDSVSSATPLSAETAEQLPSIMDLFLGLRGGAIGEVCVLALLIGFVYLLVRKVITWHIPVVFIGTVFVASLFMEGFDVMMALTMTLSGGLFLGAIFMATDYVTSPSTAWGKVIFAVGAGLITFLIRYFGTYPEGVSFAILLMNILNPYIDSWTKHRILVAGGKKA